MLIDTHSKPHRPAMADHSTRMQIVEKADSLFYEDGYQATSFAHIAAALGISRGNFYYHFKTKGEILDAVITRRMQTTRAMLDHWEKDGHEPRDRILSFINILIANRAKIMAFGCPVGTLCAELAKLDHAAKGRAAELFCMFRDWLTAQFRALGHGEAAEALAMHVLGRSQGVAALATAFRDEDVIRREVAALEEWLRALPDPANEN